MARIKTPNEPLTPAPRIISWNITTRCPLKCAHCYVDAGDRETEGVLSTGEAFRVIDQIRQTGKPVVVLSGGEPLMREDFFPIARYGTERGLRMVMGSSGFPLDRAVAAQCREAGIRAAAISLDSADPGVHDSFRGVPGAWERAIGAIRACRDEDISVQINMSVMRADLRDVEEVIAKGSGLGVQDYQLFFPVPTGRARGFEPRGPDEYEGMIRRILVRYRDSGIHVRPTCAPQFRRIAAEAGIENTAWGRGCIAGISYCRIYANGDVTPCPYLPVSAGNLRTQSFGDIWNTAPLFAALRDPEKLTGKCGTCRYKTECGGCRARAYRGIDAFSTGTCDGPARAGDITGDICGEDPWCPYEPGGTV